MTFHHSQVYFFQVIITAAKEEVMRCINAGVETDFQIRQEQDYRPGDDCSCPVLKVKVSCEPFQPSDIVMWNSLRNCSYVRHVGSIVTEVTKPSSFVALTYSGVRMRHAENSVTQYWIFSSCSYKMSIMLADNNG